MKDEAELRVRPARPADAGCIVAFQQAMARETEEKELDAACVRRGVEAALGDPGRGRYLVAERAGEVVGSLMLTTEWSDWRAGWFWWIQSVYTVPRARRRGVYRALYERVLEEARREPDVCGVRLYVEEENRVAQGVYEALGMRRSGYSMYEVELGG